MTSVFQDQAPDLDASPAESVAKPWAAAVLTLQPAAGVRRALPGAAGEGRTLLYYTQDPESGGCWLSGPVPLVDDPSCPAYWLLRETDDHTWEVRLRRRDDDLAVYRCKAPAAGTEGGVLTLRHAAGGKRKRAWPRRVTIAPAP